MLEDPQTQRTANAHIHCPRCGSRPASDVTRLVRGVWLADYIDAAGHAWFTKWVA